MHHVRHAVWVGVAVVALVGCAASSNTTGTPIPTEPMVATATPTSAPASTPTESAPTPCVLPTPTPTSTLVPTPTPIPTPTPTPTLNDIARIEATDPAVQMAVDETHHITIRAFDDADRALDDALVASSDWQWDVTGEANLISPEGVLEAGSVAGTYVARGRLTLGSRELSAEIAIEVAPGPLTQIVDLPESLWRYGDLGDG
jgi:hypothetical protein